MRMRKRTAPMMTRTTGMLQTRRIPRRLQREQSTTIARNKIDKKTKRTSTRARHLTRRRQSTMCSIRYRHCLRRLAKVFLSWRTPGGLLRASPPGLRSLMVSSSPRSDSLSTTERSASICTAQIGPQPRTVRTTRPPRRPGPHADYQSARKVSFRQATQRDALSKGRT